MSVEQLRGVINCPTQAEGLDLEPGLAELLLRDLGVAEDAGDGVPATTRVRYRCWRMRCARRGGNSTAGC